MEDLYNAQVAPVSQGTVSERLTFLKRVYSWMTGALVVCGLSAAISIKSGITENILRSSNMGFGFWILIIVGMALTTAMAHAGRHKQGLNVIFFAAFAAFFGFVLSTLVLVAMVITAADPGYALQAGAYDLTLVYQALGATISVFVGLTYVAFTTKKDLSFMRGMLTAATIGLLVMILMSFLFNSTGFHLIITGFGILLFSGYILYDTQNVMKKYPANEHVAGAITLFTDFFMLFWYILSFLIQMTGRD
jgi:FtsH-binding integral membrane protein